MRRSFDGLQALTRNAMGHNPLDGSLYVFVSRRGAQMRVLYFDRSGFCVWGSTGVPEGSRADVSFAAGLLIDKFLYHLPQPFAVAGVKSIVNRYVE